MVTKLKVKNTEKTLKHIEDIELFLNKIRKEIKEKNEISIIDFSVIELTILDIKIENELHKENLNLL